MFFKIGALTNLANFMGKHLCWSLFLIKLRASLFYRTTLVVASAGRERVLFHHRSLCLGLTKCYGVVMPDIKISRIYFSMKWFYEV